MTTTHVPAQRTTPDTTAAPAAGAPSPVELGWRALLRRTVARAGLAMVASLVLWSLLPALMGWAPRVILSGSMEPRIHVGDVIVTREVPAATLTKGQVITVKDPDHPDKTRTHRLVRRDADGSLVTKGDANEGADSSHVSLEDVLGVGVIRVPFVGRPAYWLAERNWGAVGVTAALLGLCVICAFPGARKTEDDDADRDDTSDSGSASGSRPGQSSRGRRVVAAVAVSAVAVGAMGAPAEAAFKRTTSNPTSKINAASTFYPYRSEVLGDSPYLYWRLAETGGSTVNDAGPGNHDGTLLTQTSSQGQASALVSEPKDKSLSVTMAGINANSSTTAPRTFSVEAWVRTTSTTGGRVLGFGNGNGMNPSSTVDRQLYLAPNGRAMFGVGAARTTIASTSRVNDGSWHHLVGTYSSVWSGMKLYVDGAIQGSATATPVEPFWGTWRAGAELLSGWAGNPTDYFYEGGLDELAVYTDVLTSSEVRAHYDAGTTP